MFGIDTNILMLLLVLCYGAFLGYCFGCARGYDEGSKVVMRFYKQNSVDNKPKESNK
jgi:hypothetical protein